MICQERPQVPVRAAASIHSDPPSFSDFVSPFFACHDDLNARIWKKDSSAHVGFRESRLEARSGCLQEIGFALSVFISSATPPAAREATRVYIFKSSRPPNCTFSKIFRLTYLLRYRRHRRDRSFKVIMSKNATLCFLGCGNWIRFAWISIAADH